MSTLTSSFGKFSKNHFSNLLVIFTVSTEQLASFIVFECPCDRNYNLIYGMSYLFGPALLLFIIALANQPTFWKLITGCLNRKQLFSKQKVCHILK